MSAFDASEGLLHFLFADEDDYYLDSLLCLDLNHYVFCQLKSKHYENVVYIKEAGVVKNLFGIQKEITAFCIDQKSADGYSNAVSGKNGKVVMQTQKDIFGNVFSFKGKKEDSLSRIRKLLSGKNALIIPIDVFSEMLNDVDFRENLELMKKLEKNKGIIIISASNSDRNLFKKLKEIAGKSDILFGEIKDITDQNLKLDFYRQLNIKLIERMQVYNQADRRSVEKMLRRMQLSGTFQGDADKIRSFSTVLSSIPRNLHVQAELNGIINTKKIRSLGEIKKLVSDRRRCSEIERISENEKLFSMCERTINNTVYKETLYPGKSTPPEFGAMIKVFRQNDLTGINWGDKCEKQIERIWKGLTTQWNHDSAEENVTQDITLCTELLNRYKSVHKKYQDELEYSPVTAVLEKMEYLVCDSAEDYYNPEMRKKKISVYESRIEAAKQLIENREKYFENSDSIDDYTERKIKKIQKITQIKNSIKAELEQNSEFIGKEKQDIKRLEAEVKGLDDSIKKLESKNAIINNKIHNLMGAMDNLDGSIYSISDSSENGILEAIRELSEVHENKVIDEIKFTKELDAVNSHFDSVAEMQIAETQSEDITDDGGIYEF